MYASQVKLVEQFLSNKSNYIVQKLTKSMDMAAARLDYEQAANYHQITIFKVQTQQAITKGFGNMDVLALATNDDAICVDVLFVRNGLLLGNKAYFPVAHKFNLSSEEILTTFLMQHYLQNEISAVIPAKILVNVKLQNRAGIAALLSEKFKHKVVIADNVRGIQKQLITTAEANAFNALKTHWASASSYFERLQNFKDTMQLPALPNVLNVLM